MDGHWVVCTLWHTGDVTPYGTAVIVDTWSHHETLEAARAAYADDVAAGAYGVTLAAVALSTDYDAAPALQSVALSAGVS